VPTLLTSRVPGWPREVRRATAEVDHVPYDTREVDVFYIHHDLITEFWSFSEDQAATDRIWCAAVASARPR
jgi:hypothetical protein